MFFRGATVLAVLSLAAGYTLNKDDVSELTRQRRSAPYHGPPAPLNHDGTVALTPEVHHAKTAHSAAIAKEFQRLHEAESLAAAHPDHTSPSQDYSSNHEGQYKQDQYNSDLFSHGGTYKHSPEAHIPAPLNHDGTVAQTGAYKAIAASHQAEYAKTLHSVKHQDPHFQHQASLGSSWH